MNTDLTVALRKLYGRHRFGIKLELDVMRAMLACMGSPERSFAAIHVAGTNGKGSVCAMLDSILRAAGFPVGLYTSPHLIRFHERIQVGGRCVTDDELTEALDVTERAAAAAGAECGRDPTFFECATAAAFYLFRRLDVKLAVIEVGMGGRLDATNVVLPLLSVITSIGIEHAEYLGPDIPSIAAEKAGIVKPGRPVVAGLLPDEALDVVRRVAREAGAPLIEAAQTASVRQKAAALSGQTLEIETASAAYGTVRLSLPGRYQQANVATVVTAVDALRDPCGLAIPDEAVRTGLASVRWSGRFQVARAEPPLIVDGAHNPEAGAALADALRRLVKGRALGLIVGMCGDKDATAFFRPFRGLAKRVWLTPIRDERSMPEARLEAAASAAGLVPRRTASLDEALREANAWAQAEAGAVCVCGSLFLAGEALERISGSSLGDAPTGEDAR